jgi:uncharacterized protein YndB with AHSA1/START domain
MITVRRRTTASPDDVFAVLSDGWLFAGWVVGASRMRAVDATWPSVGSELHHSVGPWPALVDDTTSSVELDPPRRMVLQARAWPAGEARVEITVEPDGDGSLLGLAEDATHGPGTLVPGLLRQLAIAPRNRETLRRLALLAEGRRG